MMHLYAKKWWLLSFVLLLSITVVNAQESNRVNVPQTNVSLIPPEGFELSNDFVGFIHIPSSSAIQVVEQPGINPDPAVTTLSFTPEVLEPQGFTLVSKEVVKTNAGVPSTLVLVSFTIQEIDFLRYILVTGSSKHMVILNGNFPAMTKEYMQEKMKESILTIWVK